MRNFHVHFSRRFHPTSLFLERFWLEFRISLSLTNYSAKPTALKWYFWTFFIFLAPGYGLLNFCYRMLWVWSLISLFCGDFKSPNHVQSKLCLLHVHLRSQWAISEFPGPLFQSEGRSSAFDMEIIFHSHANKTHVHKKGCAPSLILKVRVFGTRLWPTENFFSSNHIK